jgi:hypothetical protein
LGASSAGAEPQAARDRTMTRASRIARNFFIDNFSFSFVGAMDFSNNYLDKVYSQPLPFVNDLYSSHIFFVCMDNTNFPK